MFDYFDNILDENDNMIEENLSYYQTLEEIGLPYSDIGDEIYDDSKVIHLIKGEIINLGSISLSKDGRYLQSINAIVYNSKILLLGVKKRFFEVNTKIFKDITKEMKRDNKIKNILE